MLFIMLFNLFNYLITSWKIGKMIRRAAFEDWAAVKYRPITFNPRHVGVIDLNSFLFSQHIAQV